MYVPLLQSPISSNSLSAAMNSPSASTSKDSTGGLNTMFLQLLTAQLKAQSPINPLDANQFVAQLAQIQSLSALTQIDQLMQILVTGNVQPAASSAKAQASAANSIPNSNPAVSSVSH